MGKLRLTRTLLEAVAYFSDQDAAHDFFVALRWPNGAACPHCGNAEVAYMPKWRRWACKDCRQQFTAKTGTIFEDSPISFSKWLPAIWLLTATRNGTSSCELARALGVTQKTAWFMLQRIRESLCEGDPGLLEGPVEADEAFIGGDIKKMNAKQRPKVSREWSGRAKIAVLGIVERNTSLRKGRARPWVVPFVEGPIVRGKIRKHVGAGADVYTDGATWYKGSRIATFTRQLTTTSLSSSRPRSHQQY